MRPFLTLILAALLAPSAFAGITGSVRNATSGQPQPRVALTLILFDSEGMNAAEEVVSAADGAFAFDKDATGSRGPAMIRAEHLGVTYSKMIPPNAPTSGVEVMIYDVSQENLAPTGRVLLLQPGGREMIVNESFLFTNNSRPPRTYRDDVDGSLRFYLPPAAKGIVDASSTGPAGMPLRNTAEKTDEQDIYYVDFPIKPGENRIDLTYLVPHEGESLFKTRSMYPDLETRMAVPEAVELVGEGLQSMGSHPETKAAIYLIPPGPEITVAVKGQGSLGPPPGASRGAGPAPAPSGSTEVRVDAAPVAKELPWILGLAAAIFIVGFYNLLTAKPKEPVEAPVVSAKSPAKNKAARKR